MDFATLPIDAPANLFALSPDERSVVVVHATALTVIDLTTRAVTARGPVSGVVYACRFTPDGAGVLLGTRTPVLFDLASCSIAKAAFKGPTSAANAIAFSRDGAAAFFANGSFMAPSDCVVYAFDVATRALKWKSAPSRGDGNSDVVALGDRLVVFGEQGALYLLDAAKGAVIVKEQLTPPAPYGEALVWGAQVDDDSVVAATLEEGAALVARVHALAGGLFVQWRSTLDVPEVDEDEEIIVGRPAVTAGAVHVPVYWCAEGQSRVSLFTLDAMSGAVRGSVVLDGCQSHRALVCSREGTLVWARGADSIAIGRAP